MIPGATARKKGGVGGAGDGGHCGSRLKKASILGNGIKVVGIHLGVAVGPKPVGPGGVQCHQQDVGGPGRKGFGWRGEGIPGNSKSNEGDCCREEHQYFGREALEEVDAGPHHRHDSRIYRQISLKQKGFLEGRWVRKPPYPQGPGPQKCASPQKSDRFRACKLHPGNG